MNVALEAIISSLNSEPDKWSFRHINARTLDHVSCVSIWMANIPIFDTNVYRPAELSLNLWQKYRLYKAAKNLINLQVVEMLK